MTLKRGVNFEWVKNHTYQEKSLIWYRSCTANITNTAIIYRVRADLKQ